MDSAARAASGSDPPAAGDAMNVMDCYDCEGTGVDPAAWDGRCPFCRGTGEVDEMGDLVVVDYQDDEYLDEDDE